jgi:hypothetical protein
VIIYKRFKRKDEEEKICKNFDNIQKTDAIPVMKGQN